MRHWSIGILLSTGLQELFRDNLGHLAAPSWAVSFAQGGPQECESPEHLPLLAAFLLGPAGCSDRVTPRTPHMSSQPAFQPHPKALGLLWDQMDSFHRPQAALNSHPVCKQAVLAPTWSLVLLPGCKMHPSHGAGAGQGPHPAGGWSCSPAAA